MFETSVVEKDREVRWGILAGVATFAFAVVVGYFLIGGGIG